MGASSKLPVWINLVLVCCGCTLVLLLLYNYKIASLMPLVGYSSNVTMSLVTKSLMTENSTNTIHVPTTLASGNVSTSKTGGGSGPTMYTTNYSTPVTRHSNYLNISKLVTTLSNAIITMKTPTQSPDKQANISVVIGMGITSKGVMAKHPKTFLQRSPLFATFLRTFCNTASIGYHYHYYLAYDKDDAYYTNESNLKLFREKFAGDVKRHCQHLGIIGLHFVKCNHSGRPAWAQSDAMVAAHKDGHDFFYRVNDDSVFITNNWTTLFISELRKMRPPLLGVVGPNHIGGNTAIMTYDFVHRTHVDIFGYHYPREFPWWYADDWVTKVYLPGRSKKLYDVRLRHTMTTGTRYHRQGQDPSFVEEVIKRGQERVQQYVAALGRGQTTSG